MQLRWPLPTGLTCSNLERSFFSRVHNKLDLDWDGKGQESQKGFAVNEGECTNETKPV